MKAFDPSRRAPSAPGPKTSRPLARSRSANPPTRGDSGPMTKRPASISSGAASVQLIAWPSSVIPGMPGFPGVTTTSAVRPRAVASACSRPPDPTTQTFTGAGPSCSEAYELLAPRAHSYELDRYSDLLRQEADVALRCRRKIHELGRP